MSGSFRLGYTMANPLHIERMRSINFRLSHDCARIEAACGGDVWDRDRIIDYLRQPNAFGRTVMNRPDGDVVLGYMLYRLIYKRGEIHLDRILVRPESRRIRVGSAMLQRLKERVGVDGIRRVVVLDYLSPDDGKFCIRHGDVQALLKYCGFTHRFLPPKEFQFVYEK